MTTREHHTPSHQYVPVLDTTLHHVESGTGAPIVFLHGNPASSHLWRHVMPAVGGGRLLAPDLVGMGRSGKPDVPYAFDDHARYLDAWFDALGLDQVVLVGHDWGGALACDWASRHADRVVGIVVLESVLKPMGWDEVSPAARARTEAIRTPGVGEAMALETDTFIRSAFTGGVLTPVTDADLAAYLAPFPTPAARRPVLAWARQLPFGGEPAELVSRIEAYDAWLATSLQVPKLLLTFEGSPTLLISPEVAAWCADTFASLEVVACGTAGHHAPEDRPAEIATAVSDWLDRHGLR